jgi:hypothetical protein
MGKTAKLPKTKCCVSTTRCDRCPIRMLKEGTLPAGYGVRKRKLVRLDVSGKKAKKIKKADLAAAVRISRKTQKKSGKKKQYAA